MLHKLPNLFKLTLTLLIGGLLFTACDDDSSGPINKLNVSETIQAEDNLSSANTLLSDYDLADTLAQDRPFTVFVPTDAAIEKEDLDGLTEEEIKAILKYHIVPENLTFEELKEVETLETLQGASLQFSTEDDTVIVNDGQAMITEPGLDASNGTVFKVDTVLTAGEE